MDFITISGTLVVIIYCISLTYITIYCLMQFHLLYHYKKKNNSIQPLSPVMDKKDSKNLPFVTIQLPIYNEQYVVERLIDSIANLDYPKDKFEIHVLDDSTDETLSIVSRKVNEYKEKGFNIDQIVRENRQGFKAGALRDGMTRARGEFIAIFDADFLPSIDFLNKTIPHFKDNRVGVVQTRWGHINHDYSILTKVQAFQLNVHFTVEQLGRSNGDYLLQFNGTAGVWRKACIDSSGGWEADTLTEDLDLSYRAQLKGWDIKYLEDTISPAELPAEMNGLKSQQFRWMKGGAETAVKVLPKVWGSGLSFYQKIYASAHLLSSSVFLFVFVLGVFSVPLAFLINPLEINENYFSIFIFGLISIGIVYYVANVQNALEEGNKLKLFFKFVYLFPIFMALSMGLSFHNAIAVLQGFRGKKSPFVRTPKFNIDQLTQSFKNKNYFKGKLNGITIIEGLLTVYFALGLFYGFQTNDTSFTVMHLLLFFGYGTIFFYSIKHLSLK